MRAMVYLPDDLAEEFKRCQAQEKLAASALMQKALRLYLHQWKRQAAVNALEQVAAGDPLPETAAKTALRTLSNGRQDDPHRS